MVDDNCWWHDNGRTNLVAIYFLIFAILRRRRQRRKRRKDKFWVGQIFQKRKELEVNHTLVQELRLYSCVCCRHCVMQKVEFESCNNRCILEYIFIAFIVHVMREWFPLNCMRLITIAQIVRIELEAIQPIVIVLIVRSSLWSP